MVKNIGKKDRIIRVVIGVVLFAMINSFDNKFIQWVIFALVLLSLFSAIKGWCPVYKMLKKNTFVSK